MRLSKAVVLAPGKGSKGRSERKSEAEPQECSSKVEGKKYGMLILSNLALHWNRENRISTVDTRHNIPSGLTRTHFLGRVFPKIFNRTYLIPASKIAIINPAINPSNHVKPGKSQ